MGRALGCQRGCDLSHSVQSSCSQMRKLRLRGGGFAQGRRWAPRLPGPAPAQRPGLLLWQLGGKGASTSRGSQGRGQVHRPWAHTAQVQPLLRHLPNPRTQNSHLTPVKWPFSFKEFICKTEIKTEAVSCNRCLALSAVSHTGG